MDEKATLRERARKLAAFHRLRDEKLLTHTSDWLKIDARHHAFPAGQ